MGRRPSLNSNLNKAMREVKETTAVTPEELVERTKPTVSPDPVIVPSKASGKRHDGMRKMLIPLDPEVHRRLKLRAVQNDLTLEKIVQEAISHYLKTVQ